MSQTPPTPPDNDTSAKPAAEVPSVGPAAPAPERPAPAPLAAETVVAKKPVEKTADAAQPTESPPPAEPPSRPAKAPTRPVGAQPSSGGRVRIWLVLLALVVAGLSLFASGLMWQRLGQTQQEMARRSQDSATQSMEARAVAAQAEELTKELQARLTVAEVRLSEVSLQRSQLEELMLSLSRSRDDNLVQDIESALRLGQQQAQLTGSVQPLLSALQAADQRIGRAAQPRLNPVQRAIARDIERIQGAALVRQRKRPSPGSQEAVLQPPAARLPRPRPRPLRQPAPRSPPRSARTAQRPLYPSMVGAWLTGVACGSASGPMSRAPGVNWCG
jgi:hypothetical protein